MKNNILILKSQQSSGSVKYKVVTEKVNKTILIANNDEKVQSIMSIETYAYGTSKHLICQVRRS